MKLVRLSLALLVVTGIAASCTGNPTATSRQAQPGALPSFDEGGFMGNGGRADGPLDSTSVGDGGFMGNGG